MYEYRSETNRCLVDMTSKQGVITMEPNSGVNPAQSDIVTNEPSRPQAPSRRRERPPLYTELHPQTVIRETVIIQPPLKDSPMFYPCPVCLKRVLTKVDYVNTRRTHMLAGFICGFTCWCLLCCLAAIPYVVPTFKKVEHYCPDCNTLLGDYSLQQCCC